MERVLVDNATKLEGVGVAGFSGGATAVVTVPGGALIGGAAFSYGAQVLCSKGSGGGGGGGPTVSNQSGGHFWKSLKGFRGKTKNERGVPARNDSTTNGIGLTVTLRYMTRGDAT